MGSARNKKNVHVSRGKFINRRRRRPKSRTTEERKENVSHGSSTCPLEGSRIINLEQLASFVTNIGSHSKSCPVGNVTLIGETYRNGMASVLSAKCSSCRMEIAFSTSHKVEGVGSGKRWESNVAAVWGQMSTGGGHAHLKETMSVLGVPTMTKKAFVATESAIDKCWWQSLEESMREAAEEEKRIAIERGSYHQGVPAITVILDAGWSKRSHKHSYNAKSGVGIIVGMETKKLLYVGVRNKYCSVCARADTKGEEPPQHECHKNWDGSSSSMETDIIVQGFKEAETKYGLRYTKFVGDGDSSVYPALITGVPQWGHVITKIECANHAIKCYRGALEKLAQENPDYRGKGRLTSNMRKRLTKAARCAIKMRSAIPDRKRAVELLRADLRNGPLHCFGVHTECSTDYCQVSRGSTTSTNSIGTSSTSTGSTSTGSTSTSGTSTGSTSTGSTSTSGTSTSGTSAHGSDDSTEISPEESAGDIASQEAEEWEDALDEENLESMRSNAPTAPETVDPKMMWDIQRTVGRLISKADQLLGEIIIDS